MVYHPESLLAGCAQIQCGTEPGTLPDVNHACFWRPCLEEPKLTAPKHAEDHKKQNLCIKLNSSSRPSVQISMMPNHASGTDRPKTHFQNHEKHVFVMFKSCVFDVFGTDPPKANFGNHDSGTDRPKTNSEVLKNMFFYV